MNTSLSDDFNAMYDSYSDFCDYLDSIDRRHTGGPLSSDFFERVDHDYDPTR